MAYAIRFPLQVFRDRCFFAPFKPLKPYVMKLISKQVVSVREDEDGNSVHTYTKTFHGEDVLRYTKAELDEDMLEKVLKSEFEYDSHGYEGNPGGYVTTIRLKGFTLWYNVLVVILREEQILDV